MSAQQLLSHPIFTYYCFNCFTVLHETGELLTPGYITEKLASCPECGQPLQETLTWRQAYVTDSESQTISMETVSKRETVPPPVFQPATLLFGLASGVSRIDSALGGLKEKTYALIMGGLSNILAERLCLRAVLSRERGGLDTNPIFIDAGNCSDPYLFASYARQYQMEPKQALQRVLTSRAFTVHQLANLVIKELPPLIKQYQSRLVILADLLSMFNDPQIDEHESERVIDAVGKAVKKIRDEQNIIVVSTVSRENALAGLLLSGADIALEIGPSKNRSAILSLLKHPSRQPSSVTFRQTELFRVSRPRYMSKEVRVYG